MHSRQVAQSEKLSDRDGYATSPIASDLILSSAPAKSSDWEKGSLMTLQGWSVNSKIAKLSSSGGGVARSVRFLC